MAAPVRRIAVIGAGPGGLVAALAAATSGFEVEVYEQAAEIRGPGGSWVLNPNGLRVIEVLGLFPEIASLMFPASQLCIANLERETLLAAHYSCACIAAKELLDIFAAAAENRGVRINLKHRLIDLQIEKQSVGLRFAGGFETSADLVVGADGINSQVSDAAGIERRIEPLRHSYLKGIVSVPAGHSFPRDIWSRDHRRFGIDPLPNGRCGFYASLSRHEYKTLKEGSIEEWKQSWQDFGSNVVRVVDAVKNWDELTYDEPYHIVAKDWSRPPAFLVGDAAHAQAPNLGQGANSAMVDSLLLVKLIKELADQSEVQLQFDTLRRGFVRRTQNLSRLMSSLESLRFAPASLLRDLLFRISCQIPLAVNSTVPFLMGEDPQQPELRL